jgi:hypothetical protein
MAKANYVPTLVRAPFPAASANTSTNPNLRAGHVSNEETDGDISGADASAHGAAAKPGPRRHFIVALTPGSSWVTTKHAAHPPAPQSPNRTTLQGRGFSILSLNKSPAHCGALLKLG